MVHAGSTDTLSKELNGQNLCLQSDINEDYNVGLT